MSFPNPADYDLAARVRPDLVFKTRRVTETTVAAHRPPAIIAVKATGNGEGRTQANSMRGAVLQYVKDKNGVVTLQELRIHFKKSVRGQVQKLVTKRHLAVVEIASAQ